MLVPRSHLVPQLRHPFDSSLDRLFRDVFDGFAPAEALASGGRYPAVNAWEDEKAYHVEAELPGWEEKQLNVTVQGKELRLEGKREEAGPDESNYTHRERWSGGFVRTFHFPVEIEEGKVDASFRNGILSVALPKAQAALPRRIEVKG
jgi:HSP20 family protein